MNCAHFRDALTEAALGAQADATRGPVGDARLQAHLASCAACRIELDRLRALTSAIDSGLSRIVIADPSPAFAARLHSRIAEEVERRASRWHTWAPAIAGVMAVLALVTWFATRFTAGPSRSPDAATTQAPAPVPPNANIPPYRTPTGKKGIDVAHQTRQPIGSRVIPASDKPSLPEALVTGDEWRQVAKLYALAQKGAASADALAPPDSRPLEEKFQFLAISKLEIQPLDGNTPEALR